MVFAEKGEAILLGVIAMDSVRLAADPTNSQLIPVNLRRN